MLPVARDIAKLQTKVILLPAEDDLNLLDVHIIFYYMVMGVLL